MNIDKLHKLWNLESKHIVADEFTGYESVYSKLDKLQKIYMIKILKAQ